MNKIELNFPSMKSVKCKIVCLLTIISLGFTACSSGESMSAENEFIPPDQLPNALLASRFENLVSLKKVIQIKYYQNSRASQRSDSLNDQVICVYNSDESQITSILKKGISQAEIEQAKDFEWNAIFNVLKIAPQSIALRKDLAYTNLLARRRQDLTGWGDPAFYDLSELTVKKIIDRGAYVTSNDSGPKGYLNTFNHITAQALLTSIFSEQVADFIADVHERENMPELVTGVFTADQLNNPAMNPMDNYVDMLNNELGQELGKALKIKYGINHHTKWTPQLLTAYLNELQAYYVRSFHIGMQAFDESENEIKLFSDKINRLFNKEFDYVIPTY